MITHLSIGGITLAVRCDDPRAGWTWDEPLSRFVVDPRDADVELSVVIDDDAHADDDGTLVFDSEAVWRLYRTADGYRIACCSEAFGAAPYKTASFNDQFTRGTIRMRSDVAHLHPLDYPLDEVLIANLLGRNRGVELHGCGVIDRNGDGRLFAGVSGAGKTTTARMWEGETRGIVSDDRVIVREIDGALRMFGTPWHGEAELSSPISAPLAGVYLLVQSDAHALRGLANAEAVARLFRCAFPPFYDAGALDSTLRFLETLVMRVPVRELHFARDRGAVELVMSESA
jgi:hypothetical protein